MTVVFERLRTSLMKTDPSNLTVMFAVSLTLKLPAAGMDRSLIVPVA